MEAECTGTGDSSGGASADGAALATAEAYAKALLDGFISLETCGSCTAEVEIFAQSSESAFVESVSEAWVSVNTGPNSSSQRQGAYEESIVEALIPTLVGLAVEVQAGFSGVGEVCSVVANGGVQTGDNGVECESFVESFTETFSQSSITEAGTSSQLRACVWSMCCGIVRLSTEAHNHCCLREHEF